VDGKGRDMTRTLELLEQLIGFPTVSHASNLALIDWAEALLHSAGFSVTRLPSPCGTKAGLHARIGPDTAGGICLSGHTDVVPSEGQIWAREAFALSGDDTRVYGRGTTDMKGFVASALALAERAGQSGLCAPLSVVLSYDEEIGCVGLREMLPDLTPLLGQPDLVIVGEPTAMQLGVGHKGKTALRVICRGEAGHSALAPQFVNAIHVAAAFTHQMRSLQDQLAAGPHTPAFHIPYTTVHIGKISGGQALNIVPDQTVLDMEIRAVSEASKSEVMKAIEAACARVGDAFAREDLIALEVVNAYPGLPDAQGSAARALAYQIAQSEDVTHVDFGTEAGYFAGLGLNAVVCGPGDMSRDGHKPDEGLDLSELAACDAMMDRVLEHLTQR